MYFTPTCPTPSPECQCIVMSGKCQMTNSSCGSTLPSPTESSEVQYPCLKRCLTTVRSKWMRLEFPQIKDFLPHTTHAAAIFTTSEHPAQSHRLPFSPEQARAHCQMALSANFHLVQKVNTLPCLVCGERSVLKINKWKIKSSEDLCRHSEVFLSTCRWHTSSVPALEVEAGRAT